MLLSNVLYGEVIGILIILQTITSDKLFVFNSLYYHYDHFNLFTFYFVSSLSIQLKDTFSGTIVSHQIEAVHRLPASFNI